MTEYEIQKTVAELLDAMGVLWAASQNGLNSNGRHVNRAKKAGLKPGHPDIAIYEPRMIGGKHYLGLFLEIKTMSGKPGKEQLRWIHELGVRGYMAVFTYGLDQAIKTIEQYFKMELEDKK